MSEDADFDVFFFSFLRKSLVVLFYFLQSVTNDAIAIINCYVIGQQPYFIV